MHKGNLTKLLTALILPQCVHILSTFLIAEKASIGTRTILTLPEWVFSTAWTIWYLTLGVALYMAWTRHLGGYRRKTWVRIFYLHLVIVGVWYYLFFVLAQALWALIALAGLWCLTLLLCGLALRFDTRITYILTPYLLWISFITYTSYSVWSHSR